VDAWRDAVLPPPLFHEFIFESYFMTNIAIGAPRARHRNEMVVCLGCERRVRRKSRQQVYCSSKCRKRGAYAKNGRAAIYSADLGHDTGLGTEPHKNGNEFNALQWSKSGSSTGIVGPRRVIEAEVFGSREWRDEISADGVRSQVSTLVRRALVN
jgi:hypothetical protein